MSKPKGKTPSLICGVRGKPTLEQLSRQTSCTRCEAAIPKGHCFKIPKVGSGFSSKQSFCHSCFGAILEQSRLDINDLEITLKTLVDATRVQDRDS